MEQLMKRYRNTEFKLRYFNNNNKTTEEKTVVFDAYLYMNENANEKIFRLKLNLFGKDNIEEIDEDMSKLHIFPFECVWFAKNTNEIFDEPMERVRNIGRGTNWVDLCSKLADEVYLMLDIETANITF